jgi:hypothetical protein
VDVVEVVCSAASSNARALATTPSDCSRGPRLNAVSPLFTWTVTELVPGPE